ncbi:mannitol-1-phosphate 5-dehydrogenase [Escherichia coli O69:H11 str. 07-3763]|nr:mannitol-1-phosphate 5-dehydrogenase [Escherichia coli O69:H11 str. 07-3763]
MPDATLTRLIMPTNRSFPRPDKALAPHPATNVMLRLVASLPYTRYATAHKNARASSARHNGGFVPVSFPEIAV